jgi:hypothetical protein
MYEHHGACGCGAVTFTYRCPKPLAELQARACQCEYCRPRRQAYVGDPDGSLRVRVRDQRYLYAHRFGTGTADFIHCAVCNHQVFVRSEIEGHTYALVCVEALQDHPQLGSHEPVDFEGESVEERLRRRARSWIGELVIESDE